MIAIFIYSVIITWIVKSLFNPKVLYAKMNKVKKKKKNTFLRKKLNLFQGNYADALLLSIKRKKKYVSQTRSEQ